jgi:hypothetical protein
MRITWRILTPYITIYITENGIAALENEYKGRTLFFEAMDFPVPGMGCRADSK